MRISLITPHIYYRTQRRIDDIRKFIGNYMYYRKRSHSHSQAWSMAKDTL